MAEGGATLHFSETFRRSGPEPVFSPDGRYLATAVEYRLVIRDVDTLQVAQLYSCLDKIESLQWSPDSTLVLCGLFKRSLVQAWSAEDPEWSCKIDDGPAGIAACRWSPDGAHVLTSADFGIRLTAWSLASRTCVHIPRPKYPDRGIAFSPDGRTLAVLERRDCKDAVALYAAADWAPLRRFEAAATADAADLSWSPDGTHLAVWDSVLEYRIAVYTPDGRLVSKLSPYAGALGIKTVAWCPSGQLLAVGSFDGAARVLNHLTWSQLAERRHVSPVDGPPSAVVYREEEARVGGGGGPSGAAPAGPATPDASEAGSPERAAAAAAPADGPLRARYAVADLPAVIPSLKPGPPEALHPKLGVGLMAWSADSRYLATRCDSMPTAAWVWDMARLELAAVLLQLEPVRALAWDPHAPRLALASGGARVYLWTPAGASCVHIPSGAFGAHGVAWSPAGGGFVVSDRDAFCCAYMAWAGPAGAEPEGAELEAA